MTGACHEAPILFFEMGVLNDFFAWVGLELGSF
jgi:hypothetical protein